MPRKSNRMAKRWPADESESFCDCFLEGKEILSKCTCGEDVDLLEWRWLDTSPFTDTVLKLSHDNTQVKFHPNYSLGTGIVKGDINFRRNITYYWEIKMMTEPFGSDIVIGMGTEKFNIWDSFSDYSTFLGSDKESYGMSYNGEIWHGSEIVDKAGGFGMGTIIGVKLDLWEGTLEYFLNRKGIGVSFRGLRKHYNLYPMATSTASHSVIRLIYSASWRTCLLVNAGKILANAVREEELTHCIPPGLRNFIKTYFFITLPRQKPEESELADEARSIIKARRRQVFKAG